jgi:hypothetical protein
MENLPCELIDIIYAYDGRYKQIMAECFEVIDFRVNRTKAYNTSKTPVSFFGTMNYHLNKRNHHKMGKLLQKLVRVQNL